MENRKDHINSGLDEPLVLRPDFRSPSGIHRRRVRAPRPGNRSVASPFPHATGISGGTRSDRGAGRARDARNVRGRRIGCDGPGRSDPDVPLVRQPAWSRDGTRIAWVGIAADGTSADVMTAAPDGAQATDAPSPSCRSTYPGVRRPLGSDTWGTRRRSASSSDWWTWPRARRADRSRESLLHLVVSDGEADAGARGHRPARPARARRLAHPPRRSTGDVQRAGLDRGRRTLIYVSEGGRRERLVANDVGTERREVLARFTGAIAFVVSPDGRRVAFQVLHGGRSRRRSR